MNVDSVPAGSTNVSVTIGILDVTDGTLHTGFLYTDAGIKLSYTRGPVGDTTVITPATLASEVAAHSDGGFVERDAVNAAGAARLDLPDAACAVGARYVDIFAFATAWQASGVPALRLFLDPIPDVIEGAIIADGSNSTIQGMTDLNYLTYPANQLNRRTIQFRTGNNVACQAVIDDVTVDGSNNVILHLAAEDALPNAMATSDQFVILNAAAAAKGAMNAMADLAISNAALATAAAVAAVEADLEGLALIRTTIATLASQTSFTLVAGSADDDAYNNMTIIVIDQATAEQKAIGLVSDYTGVSKTVTLLADPGIFTMAVGDIVIILTSAGGASPTEVVAACGTALTTYDPPTNTEMLAAHVATDADIAAVQALAAASAAWGSINSGIVFRGSVSAADPGVSFTVGGLAGQGAGAFIDTNTPWYAYVFRDGGGAGAAPQGEVQQVTGYTSATGLFTTDAFTEPVAVGDDIIIMSGRIAAVPDILEDTGTTLPAQLTAISAKLPAFVGLKKGTAIEDFSIPMRDADGDLVSGLTVTGQIKKDGGAFAPLTSTITEDGSTGMYDLTTSPALSASEMNADQVVLLFTATGAKPTIIQIFTES